jgi:hypothetical protein
MAKKVTKKKAPTKKKTTKKKATSKKTAKTVAAAPKTPSITVEQIRVRAYEIYCSGQNPSNPDADWQQAEQLVS